ncbi:MAG TPA: UDP-2,3-diacylglucosamine diphosphatase [Polyangiaceae bacterium]|jgi:predicted phosphodiesterase
MHIAVISDLHLGARDRADSFGHRDGDFLRFLTFLEDNFERIVLLGDIWETLAGSLPGNPAAQLSRARQAHQALAERLSRSAYTYVYGNHDLAAARVDQAPEYVEIDADGTRILFAHGHQSDALVRHNRWVSELGVWVGGWIRRLGLKRAYEFFASLDERRGGISSSSDRCQFQRWAVRAARQHHADVVVTGHTHRPVRAEHGDRLFLNSGSCSEGRFSYVSMDTRRGDYAINAGF